MAVGLARREQTMDTRNGWEPWFQADQRPDKEGGLSGALATLSMEIAGAVLGGGVLPSWSMSAWAVGPPAGMAVQWCGGGRIPKQPIDMALR